MAFPAGAQSGRSVTLLSPHSLITLMLPYLVLPSPRYPWIITTLGGRGGRRGKMEAENRASQLCALRQKIAHLPGAWFTPV